MTAWLNQHRAAFVLALRRIGAAPLNALLSLLVIGIAMTLPALGYVVLDQLRELGHAASGAQQISVFMTMDAGRRDAGEIEQRLRAAQAGRWYFVPREEALKRIQASEGMAEIVASLPRNPLPDAFVIDPGQTDPQRLEIMRKEIAGWPKVAHVQLDSAWVQRFDAFLRLGQRVLWLLAGLFAAGLVAVTFNTIRLQVVAHTAEIEVARMIGATDAFIRRPFYYHGAVQGALGGVLAAALVLAGLHALGEPVAQLAALYGSHFALRPPGGLEVFLLAGMGAILGGLGAQLSVRLALRQLD